MQPPPPPTQRGTPYIDSHYADDNHLQKSTILSSTIYRYKGHRQTLHHPNPSLTIFVQFDHEIVWNCCVIQMLYQASAHDAFYII